GVRVDTHVYSGYAIPPSSDAMIAKVIVHAPTRREAIIRMDRALSEFIIEGVKTNIAYQRSILANEYFRAGNITPDFIARRM
ncbi:MAG: acetyl-CoA carboxylase biotin carboxylase subunit, partial [Abditibacteriota bacterium]|nr:acetyl-CoA carboxylase biotin carboxylase subunit [Abditibacteriota bacterium]